MSKRTEPEGRCALFERRPLGVAWSTGFVYFEHLRWLEVARGAGPLRRGEREGVGTEG